MDMMKIHDALECAMSLARTANGYIEAREPWKLAKDPACRDELDEVLASLIRSLIVLSALLLPVMPKKMDELAAGLGLPAVPSLKEAVKISPAGLSIKGMTPLFPKPENPED